MNVTHEERETAAPEEINFCKMMLAVVNVHDIHRYYHIVNFLRFHME